MNQVYVSTVQLLLEVAPAVFEYKFFALKGGTALNLFVQAGKYIESLAFLHLNAESCLSSRASRLLGKELTSEDKGGLLLSAVSREQMRAYQQLSNGHQTRGNSLEMFSCDHAGLTVASSAKY